MEKVKYKTCTEYWLDTKNNRFRGEFEEMYRDIDDPWGCSEKADSLNNNLFLEIIFHNSQYDRILDIGCGVGDLTMEIARRSIGSQVTGMDISQTAIDKAKLRYPDVNFICRNILSYNISEDGPYNLIAISEVFWYLLDDISKVLNALKLALAKEGVIAIHQFFPAQQKYGVEVINGIDGFENVLCDHGLEFINKCISSAEDGDVLLATIKVKA